MPVFPQIRISVTRTGITLRDWSALIKSAWMAVGETWHKQILPKHFTPAGAKEYRYKKRTAKYQRRKLRKFGHQDPLVFTGRLRSEVSYRYRVIATAGRGTKGKVKVRLYGPRYLFAYHKGLQVDKADELTRLSRADVRKLGRAMDAILKKEIERARKKKSKRRTSKGFRAA